MVKTKIYATGNETLIGEYNLSHYIFEKDKSFLDWLAKLLVDVLELENGEQQARCVAKKKYDEEGNWIKDEFYFKDVAKMIDVHEKYTNKKERIDLFYGRDRVYLTLRKSKEIKEKFSAFVLKTRDWIEVKELLELPKYAGKKV